MYKEEIIKVYQLIETWDAEEIKKATKIIKEDDQLKALVEERYGSIYRLALKQRM